MREESKYLYFSKSELSQRMGKTAHEHMVCVYELQSDTTTIYSYL